MTLYVHINTGSAVNDKRVENIAMPGFENKVRYDVMRISVLLLHADPRCMRTNTDDSDTRNKGSKCD